MTDSKVSGLVLLNKIPGMTSFSAIGRVKRILSTRKVGHTGTLDSFAQGLLVVCAGSLTRLAGLITAFDKTYEAVIEFGVQTDTLDPTGEVVKTAPLPCLDALLSSLKKFSGDIMQTPPEFSAIKINGQRASDLTRAGKKAVIPPRPVKVYESVLLEIEFDDGKKINYGTDLYNTEKRVRRAKIRFTVSKGTYIRCLARDIGEDCGSAGHLSYLYRTRVGNFKVEDAVTLADIKSGDYSAENEPSAKDILKPMTPVVAAQCGLFPVTLKSSFEDLYYNGRPVKTSWLLTDSPIPGTLAVFTEKGLFCGALSFDGRHFSYEYIVPRVDKTKML